MGVAGGTYTDKLIRIGIALMGGEILFANILFIALVLALHHPEDLAIQAPVIATGLAAGAVIVTGAWIRKTADRGFTGACVALAGAVFLWTCSASVATADSGAARIINIYVLLFFSPAGVPLEVALLAVGLKVFARERLAGLCMMVPGAGFLPFLVYEVFIFALGFEFPEILVPVVGAIIKYGGVVVGAAMLVLGLVMVWQARRMRSDHAPVTA